MKVARANTVIAFTHRLMWVQGQPLSFAHSKHFDEELSMAIKKVGKSAGKSAKPAAKRAAKKTAAAKSVGKSAAKKVASKPATRAAGKKTAVKRP